MDTEVSSRDRILQAALILFMRNGYSGTSLKDIATEVGISTPALYWHFKSKDEIYFTAVEQFLREFVEYVTGSVTAEDPSERLTQFVVAHVTWQLQRSEIASAFGAVMGMRQLVSDLEIEKQTDLLQMERGYMSALSDILEQGISIGRFSILEPTVTAFAIVTMCEYVHTWFRSDGKLTPTEVAAQYASFALRTVGAPE